MPGTTTPQAGGELERMRALLKELQELYPHPDNAEIIALADEVAEKARELNDRVERVLARSRARAGT